MKIDNSFALAVSIAIAVSLTTTMDQVRAEADSIVKPQATDSIQMKKVNVNRALTRTKLKTMSADSVLKLSQEGKVNLTTADLSELNALTGNGKKIKINAQEYSTVMCPW
jgi:DNA uptake protein ComE-like DNA-binding protein